MNLFPQSLAGRLVFWLLLSLLAVQAGLAAVQWRQKQKLELQLQQSSLHSHVISMARALDTTDPQEWRTVIEQLDAPDIKVEVDPKRLFQVPDDAANVFFTKTEKDGVQTIEVRRVAKHADGKESDGPHETHSFTWSAKVATRNAEDADDKVVVSPKDKHHVMDFEFSSGGNGVSIPLDDGQWLNAAFAHTAHPGFRWQDHLALFITALLVAIVVIVVVQLETRSLKTLALAADRLGRGEELDPLPETGPKETRTALMAFNRMGDRLSRFVRDRTRMLAAMSHDLRTPLTSMRLQVEEVQDSDLRDRLIANIEEMRQMADASLEFARADADGEAAEPVDLAELVGEVADGFAEQGQEIDCTDLAPVTATVRPMALRRALRNLVENALRYGTDVTVRLGAEPGQAHVDVLDRGPGIPEEDMERVFEPFVRLETSRNRETGGVGLGLAITRTILRGAGGDVLLANRDGGGLRARIVLPLD